MCVGDTKIIGDEEQWKHLPIKTAFTDGKNCYFFREFIEGLSDEELRFVVLHETYHKLYRQLCNWMPLFKANAPLANAACDYRVNADILAHNNVGVKMPSQGLYDDKYADPMKWSVDRIYKDLQENGFPPQKCTGNCKSGQGGAPLDGQCTCPQGFDEHGWEDAQSMSPEEQRLLAQEIDQAIRQGQRLASQMGGGADRAIGELLKVRTDWRAATRDFLTTFIKGGDELSWSRINRRSVGGDGELMPGTIQESTGELAIWNDASGSISQQELTLFLSHIVHITKTIKPIRITIGFWDTKVHGHQTFEPNQYDSLLKTVVAKGGGGTEVNCVHGYMKKHKMTPEANIILSDGYLSSTPKDFGIPTLWGVLDNPGFTAPSPQKTLHLDEGWAE